MPVSLRLVAKRGIVALLDALAGSRAAYECQNRDTVPASFDHTILP
jgi:hypothetical protein